MKRRLAGFVAKVADRAGYELRRRDRASGPVELERVTDAIYAQDDVIFHVPRQKCYYPYLYSYGDDGWHPFVATLREVLANPALAYGESTLCRFYQRHQPTSVREALFEPGSDDSGVEELDSYSTTDYLPLLPWDPGLVRLRGEKGLDAGHGNQGYGPVSETKGGLEFGRLVETMRSIESTGYRPAAHGDGEIRGYFLKVPGDYRFILRSGLHRAAALAALGHETIRVGLFQRYPRAIHLCDVEDWPAVAQGLFGRAAAERYFRRFFRETGREKAARLGLLQSERADGAVAARRTSSR